MIKLSVDQPTQVSKQMVSEGKLLYCLNYGEKKISCVHEIFGISSYFLSYPACVYKLT